MLPIGCKHDVCTEYLALEVGRELTSSQADTAARYGRQGVKACAVGANTKIKTLSEGWINCSESENWAILEKLPNGNFLVKSASRRIFSEKTNTEGNRYNKEVV